MSEPTDPAAAPQPDKQPAPAPIHDRGDRLESLLLIVLIVAVLVFTIHEFVSMQNTGTASLLAGLATAELGLLGVAVNWRWGSSKGSQAKDAALAASIQQNKGG